MTQKYTERIKVSEMCTFSLFNFFKLSRTWSSSSIYKNSGSIFHFNFMTYVIYVFQLRILSHFLCFSHYATQDWLYWVLKKQIAHKVNVSPISWGPSSYSSCNASVKSLDPLKIPVTGLNTKAKLLATGPALYANMSAFYYLYLLHVLLKCNMLVF